MKGKKKMKPNQIGTSCPTERCEIGKICSMRLYGNYNCRCSSPSSNLQCDTGLLFSFLLFFLSQFWK